MTTIQNKQAHPLWSEPDCIRFSCHVSPELLVTSAVKSPLVRRKVRPWAMAASIWGSWARVANAKRSPTAERTLLSIIPNGGLRNPPTRRRMERMAKVGSAKAESKVHGSKREDKAQENKTHGSLRAKATKDISLKVRRNPSTQTSTPTTIALVAVSHRRQAIRQRSMAVSHRKQEIIIE